MNRMRRVSDAISAEEQRARDQFAGALRCIMDYEGVKFNPDDEWGGSIYADSSWESSIDDLFYNYVLQFYDNVVEDPVGRAYEWFNDTMSNYPDFFINA